MCHLPHKWQPLGLGTDIETWSAPSNKQQAAKSSFGIFIYTYIFFAEGIINLSCSLQDSCNQIYIIYAYLSDYKKRKVIDILSSELQFIHCLSRFKIKLYKTLFMINKSRK